MKPKISKFILFLAYNFSFVFLNSCQQKPNNQDIDQDLKKIKQNLDTLMKELNVKTFKELHNLLIKYKKNNIKISNDLLDALHVKDLDSAITVVNNLIIEQNNSKKAHILSCFMFDANGIISYDSLLNKFDDEAWKKEYENEIMLLCDKLGIEKSKLNSNLQIDKEIINLAKSYAQDMLPSFQKVIQKAKDAFFQELQTQCEKQNKQVFLLTQFLLGKNALEFSDDLKNQFATTWISNHPQETCDAFGLKEIASFNQDMLTQDIIEKAQKSAKQAFSFCQKELQTQCEKQNKQVLLLSQFLLEQNALEFSDDLKNQFVKTWILEHNEETCDAFGLDKIDSFDQNMLTQNIIDSVHHLMKVYYSSYQNMLNKKVKEINNKELFILNEFEHDFENLSENRRKTLLEIIRSLIVIASAKEDQQQNDYDMFLVQIRTKINDFIKSSYLKSWDERWKKGNDEIYDEYPNNDSI